MPEIDSTSEKNSPPRPAQSQNSTGTRRGEEIYQIL